MSWRPRFFEENDLFASIRDAALRFAGDATFPSPERIDEVLRDRVPIHFVRAAQQDKRLYDERIVKDAEVSTRDGSWHDFLNALVWATFPHAKTALHRRQHRLVVPGAPHRTPEGDALAMLDEGGVFCVGPSAAAVVFGHAIFEGLVLRRPVFAAGLTLSAADDVDRRAAATISDATTLTNPRELLRVDLGV
jgi:hypothetical protein